MHTYAERSRTGVLIALAIVVSLFLLLVIGVSVQPAHAATAIVQDSFGTGATGDPVIGWTAGGAGAEVHAAGNGMGNNTASPDGGSFALIEGKDGSICRTINTQGFSSVSLSYYWRGDVTATAADRGIVEIKPVAKGVTCADTSGWTTLESDNLTSSDSWNTSSVITSTAMNNSTFLLRFRDAVGKAAVSYRVDGVLVTGTTMMPPTATSTALLANENSSVTATLLAGDPNGRPLAYRIVSGPANGTLSAISGNQVTYTPNAYFYGTDSFTFVANDGMFDSNVATVTIKVLQTYQSPIAQNQSLSSQENVPYTTTLVATDSNGNPLRYSVVRGPSNGSVSIVGNQATYTPNPGFYGADSFAFVASDGVTLSNLATVSIAVMHINHPPVSQNESANLFENTPSIITLAATDADGDPLTYSIVTAPAYGTLSIVSGNQVTYTPNPNFYGTDSFTYKANDGMADSAVSTVTLTVAHVDQAPVVANETYSVAENSNLVQNLYATTDSDSGWLTFSVVTPPAEGIVLIGDDDGQAFFNYIPNANYTGPDSFTYKANDGTFDSNVGTVTLTVN